MDDHGIPGLVQQLLLDQVHMGDLGHLLLDVAVILDVDAALGDQGGNGFGVFGISLGHGQADIGPFHSTSLLFICLPLRQRRREKFCYLYSTRFCARMQAPWQNRRRCRPKGRTD